MRLHISWSLVIDTVEKFTLSFLTGLLTLALMIYLNHNSLIADQTWFPKLLITIGIFAPLLVSVEWMGVMKRTSKIRWALSAVIVILAYLYNYLWLPDSQYLFQTENYTLQMIIHALLARGTLFWIVPAMMKRNAPNTRAHACKLIGETIVTGLFCGVLYLGLAAAIKAIQFLFTIHIPEQLYGDMAAIIFFGFGVFFWLSHLTQIPPVYKYTEKSFPKVLRIFAEYILGFLLVIYAVILLAYTLKILVTGTWPNGMVASLIFGFVGMGMVYSAILLPRTLNNVAGRLHARILGVLFVGCAILLVAALHLRVIEYGWTVKRTLVVLIAIWIVLLACSLLLARPSLKWWIISGTVLAFAGMYAPVNMFSIAKDDQLVRLTNELSSLGIRQPGDKAISGESTKTTQNISSRVEYLLSYHGTEPLQAFVSPELLTTPPKQDIWTLGSNIMTSRGLSYEPNSTYINMQEGFGPTVYFFAQNPSYVPVNGYSALFFLEAPVEGSVLTGGNGNVSYLVDLGTSTLSVGGATPVSLSPLIDQAKMLQGKQQPGALLPGPLTLTGNNFMLYLTMLNAENLTGETSTITNMQGVLLVR